MPLPPRSSQARHLPSGCSRRRARPPRASGRQMCTTPDGVTTPTGTPIPGPIPHPCAGFRGAPLRDRSARLVLDGIRDVDHRRLAGSAPLTTADEMHIVVAVLHERQVSQMWRREELGTGPPRTTGPLLGPSLQTALGRGVHRGGHPCPGRAMRPEAHGSRLKPLKCHECRAPAWVCSHLPELTSDDSRSISNLPHLKPPYPKAFQSCGLSQRSLSADPEVTGPPCTASRHSHAHPRDCL